MAVRSINILSIKAVNFPPDEYNTDTRGTARMVRQGGCELLVEIWFKHPEADMPFRKLKIRSEGRGGSNEQAFACAVRNFISGRSEFENQLYGNEKNCEPSYGIDIVLYDVPEPYAQFFRELFDFKNWQIQKELAN